MKMETILLERHKASDYTVNFDNKKYIWAGAKGSIVGKRVVPMEVYDYLSMFTSCFKNGELIIGKTEKKEKVEELKENMYNKEEYEANGLTKEEVIKILKGTVKQMEKELNKITSSTTKKFVLDVAKEIGLDNFNKQKFLKEWLNYPLSIEEMFGLD